MSDENKEAVADETKPGEVVDWEAKAKAADAEVARLKGIADDAIKTRDAIKAKAKSPDKTEKDDTKDYLKTQVDSMQAQLGKYAEKAKSGAISAAATAKFTAAGINPDAIALAIKSMDRNQIDYDEDSEEVSETTLAAQVAKVKAQYPFMFEQKINGTKARMSTDGSKSDANTISDQEWRGMNTQEQRTAIKAGRRRA